MLVEDDEDIPEGYDFRSAFLQELEENQPGVTPARLQRIMAMKEITYRMKNRKEKMAIKIEELFRQKREQLYQLRLRTAPITAANGYATIGNEFQLRLEILSLVEKEKEKQHTAEDDPYNYKFHHERLRRIRERIVNRRDAYDGRAILHCAAAGGHFHIVRMLCHEFQVDVNLPTIMGKATPLHIAVEKGFRQIASLLITMGADVNARDDQGNAPLHFKKPTMAKLLLRFGADPTVKNRRNRSAYEHYLYLTPQKEVDNDLMEFLREKEDQRSIEMIRERIGQEKLNKAKDQNAHPMAISSNTTTTESRIRRDVRALLIGST